MTMNKRLKLAVATANGLMILGAASSQAQVLEEVVVTAQKREEVAQDVGISITAMSGSTLRGKLVRACRVQLAS